MDKFRDIMIYRKGIRGTKMESIDITQILSKKSNYKLINNALEKTEENVNNEVIEYQKPPITILNGKWNHKNIIKSTSMEQLDKLINSNYSNSQFSMDFSLEGFEADDEEEYFSDESHDKNTFSNILGNNVELNCYSNYYYLKPIEATKENVSYYNCQLLDQNDTFFFDNKEDMAMFQVNISLGYVDDYIMDNNRGLYLEYFNTYHIHIPTSELCRGYIILAKNTSPDVYELSAIKIPYGKALVIPPNVIHNDCFLSGDYNIVYGKAKKYSTAILKNCGELVKFNFL